MRLNEICISIRERHRGGESYQVIADSMGITKAMAWQIAHGYHPGPRTIKILRIDPSPALISTRNRRSKLNEVAANMGYPSWSAYETAMLKGIK